MLHSARRPCGHFFFFFFCGRPLQLYFSTYVYGFPRGFDGPKGAARMHIASAEEGGGGVVKAAWRFYARREKGGGCPSWLGRNAIVHPSGWKLLPRAIVICVIFGWLDFCLFCEW